MANYNSSKHNPALQNVDRPFSELFQLLPLLGSLSSDVKDQEILEAVQEHVDNGRHILISGIQSLGVLLSTAANNHDMGLDLKDVTTIGFLLKALGELLEGCECYSKN